jgi:hypothetical protein
MIYRWSQIEADFQRHYSIEDPGIITWRRFMVLIVNLPVDDSVFYAPFFNAAQEGTTYKSEVGTEPPKGWVKKELDRIRGRNRPRKQVSLDQFVKESKGQGKSR